jgi:hypothetical protein
MLAVGAVGVDTAVDVAVVVGVLDAGFAVGVDVFCIELIISANGFLTIFSANFGKLTFAKSATLKEELLFIAIFPHLRC